MVINFNDIKEEIKPNFKGGNKEFIVKTYEDDLNKIMKANLHPGASIGIHTHENDSEIIYIIDGMGKTITNDISYKVTKGDILYCKKGNTHTLINDSNADLIFVAIVTKQ